MTDIPTAFISYSWDDEAHKLWAADLAARLRATGVDVALDRWRLHPGDRLPEFMEASVRESMFVLIVCTPRYKAKSEKRLGGVGFEGDVMTAEVMTRQNHRKFIPVLRSGQWQESAPSWLAGKYYIDLRGDPYSEVQYRDLLSTLLGRRWTEPPIGQVPDASSGSLPAKGLGDATVQFNPIKILGVIADEVSMPRNDGTRGSALYRIPFRLSRSAPQEWDDAFIEAWDHPTSYTLMHRPGIAQLHGDHVVLNGTTIEEVEQYHRNTLILAAEQANVRYSQLVEQRKREAEEAASVERQHRRHIEGRAKRIRFDE